MKKTAVCILLIFFLPMLAVAAQVFGRLKYEDRSVGEGVNLKFQCEGKDDKWVNTDANGSYKTYLPGPKKCKVVVYFRNDWTGPHDIYVDETDPVRYDFEIIRQSDGKFGLRRR